MAGHSKWAQIKRQKGTADEKRGRLFSKIARTIILAARAGDPNPETNQKLRVAVEKAKSVNMPKDNIERAIAKGSNKNEAALEEFLYEAYGPEGSALLIEGITDSKNRSTQEIKHLLSEYSGKFANPGTVLWLFDKKGIVEIPLEGQGKTKDEIELCAIDAGAESIEEVDGALTVIIPPEELRTVEGRLKNSSLAIAEAYTGYIPKSTLSLSPAGTEKIEQLLEKLDEYDDIQEVYTNLA